MSSSWGSLSQTTVSGAAWSTLLLHACIFPRTSLFSGLTGLFHVCVFLVEGDSHTAVVCGFRQCMDSDNMGLGVVSRRIPTKLVRDAIGVMQGKGAERQKKFLQPGKAVLSRFYSRSDERRVLCLSSDGRAPWIRGGNPLKQQQVVHLVHVACRATRVSCAWGGRGRGGARTGPRIRGHVTGEVLPSSRTP